MHGTALRIGRLFFELYWQKEFKSIVDFGSYDFNGTLREVAPGDAVYTGLDIDEGPGVDIRIKPNEKLPLEDNFADVVVTSSVFEHDECFWETFLELVRITKPGGYIYVNVPSNGEFHRHPSDFWRFYPEAGVALTRWAGRNGHKMELVESFLANRDPGEWSWGWNDFVAVFRKEGAKPQPAQALLCDRVPCTNIFKGDSQEPQNYRAISEDMVLLQELTDKISQLKTALTQSEAVIEAIRSSRSWRFIQTAAKIVPLRRRT